MLTISFHSSYGSNLAFGGLALLSTRFRALQGPDESSLIIIPPFLYNIFDLAATPRENTWPVDDGR